MCVNLRQGGTYKCDIGPSRQEFVLLVLELGVSPHVEICKILPCNGRMRSIADGLHGFELHLVAHKIERLWFWKLSDFVDVLLSEVLLLLGLLQEGYFR